MVWWKPWGIGALAVLMTSEALWMQGSSSPEPPAPYRTYTATGQVIDVKTLGNQGCTVKIRMHQWVSISAGFPLGEIPQRGQIYTLRGASGQCQALQIVLASGRNLEVPPHVYYKAGQLPSGG